MSDLAAADELGTTNDVRWPTIAGTITCVLGVIDSAYLTYAHFDTKVQLACPDKGFINCASVTTSRYSHLPPGGGGLPVSLLGLLFFIAMLVLQLPAAWRSHNNLLRRARVAMASIGVVMVLWLVYAELFKLNEICIFCTGVHILTLIVFITTLMGTNATAIYSDEEE